MVQQIIEREEALDSHHDNQRLAGRPLTLGGLALDDAEHMIPLAHADSVQASVNPRPEFNPYFLHLARLTATSKVQ